jgi:hypothetical protein
MWASGHNGNIKRAAHGYEQTREAAMAAFAKSCGGEMTAPAGPFDLINSFVNCSVLATD